MFSSEFLICGCIKFLATGYLTLRHIVEGEVPSPSWEHIQSISSGWIGMWQVVVIGRGDPPTQQCQKLYTPQGYL